MLSNGLNQRTRRHDDPYLRAKVVSKHGTGLGKPDMIDLIRQRYCWWVVA